MINTRILQTVILVAMVTSTAYGQPSKGKKQKRYPANDYPGQRIPQENPYPNDPRYPDYPQYPNDRNSTRLNSSHSQNTYDVFGLNINSDHLDTEDKDRKSTRLNSSHSQISYAVFCLNNT